MSASRLSRVIFAFYMVAFFTYLFAPLLVMSAATFNTSRFPTVIPWQGTTLAWFVELWNDRAMWKSVRVSVIVAFFVVLTAVPIGTAAALLLTSLHSRARGLAYGLMVSPLLTPGVVVGVSMLVLWRQLGVGGGLFMIVVAQSSFIACYVMLMVAARLQRFDRAQEEAALGLGASRFMVFRRILLPYLRPALYASAFLAVLQSFENYNTTLFVRGVETPLTIFIASKVRTGLTPAVNALALAMIALTVLGAILYEVIRQRQLAHAARQRAAPHG